MTEQEMNTLASNTAQSVSRETHVDEQLSVEVLQELLGDAYHKLEMFHVKHSQEGVDRGLISPRDVDILWERHILNSAAIVPFINDYALQVSSSPNSEITKQQGVSSRTSAITDQQLSGSLQSDPSDEQVSDFTQSEQLNGQVSDLQVSDLQVSDPITLELSSKAVMNNVEHMLSIADIGSGGGFPGIVAAACLPHCKFTLIEPMERRVAWLCECVELMNLQNVTIIRSRSEDISVSRETFSNGSNATPYHAARKDYRNRRCRRGSARNRHSMNNRSQGHNVVCEQGATFLERYSLDENLRICHVSQINANSQQAFDIVTCRAVAPLQKLCGWTLPLLRSGGQLIALKGRSAQEEIDKAADMITKYGGQHARVCEAPVGHGFESTRVVLIDKR